GRQPQELSTAARRSAVARRPDGAGGTSISGSGGTVKWWPVGSTDWGRGSSRERRLFIASAARQDATNRWLLVGD
ncbi:MAG: hypothetical protein L0Y78_02545, partial [candidate division NC10 bacterium]|nr:hypothetical protein [candidate division NC10 bacterium]